MSTLQPEQKLARKEGSSLRDLFNRFLEEDFFPEPFDFTRNARLGALFNRQFTPRVDVSQTETQVKVVADVAGISPEDIDIDIQDNRLRLSGSTYRESSPDERPYRYERTYGEFSRELTLPAEVDRDAVKAVYKDGTLTITIPKSKGVQKDKIKIERQ